MKHEQTTEPKAARVPFLGVRRKWVGRHSTFLPDAFWFMRVFLSMILSRQMDGKDLKRCAPW
ncbi:hypothetical protein C6495_09465 [Candidatus Poribacteria bacterium]|nr:MAG: hypothetical protein C6495_09465 [Candidatus Poribacteria bacterium]